MRLAYIDETYTPDDFWIVWLVIPETVARPLETAMNTIVARANKRFPEISLAAELHGYALDAGSEDWKPIKGKSQARVDIYTEAIKALCDLEGIYLFRTAVHLSKLSWGAQHAHDWALKFLFEKIDKKFLGNDLVQYSDYLDLVKDWAYELVTVVGRHRTPSISVGGQATGPRKQ